RLLAVVHQLGEPSGDPLGEPSGDPLGEPSGDSLREPSDAAWSLRGEATLIQLEHLVGQPRLLAHLLMHLHDLDPSWAPRATVSRRVRQLIELDERRGVRTRRRGTLGASLDFPDLARWRPLDDALAAASMRGLLVVDVDGGDLVYRLQPGGARLLEDHFYTEGHGAARQLEVSGVVREFLPRWDGAWIAEQLEDARESVSAFRYAEQIPLERSVLPEIFLVTFDERL
ncbi:MAG: hypothetical protein AAFY88_21400, partial [Acidobacteriota bacterium]